MKKSFGILGGLMILALAGICFIGFNVWAAAPTAMPVISRGCPAYASVDVATNANDSDYGTTWRGNTPGWLAYDLSAVPAAQRAQVVVAWYNPDTYDYDPTIKSTGTYGSLNSYTLEANAAAGGGTSAPTSGWVTLATVSNNIYHSRQHVVNLSGYNWVRLYVTSANASGGNWVSINMDVHNANQGVEDDWIFYGDSITAGGMTVGSGTTFAKLINASKSNYFPVAECGGTGSIFSTDGANKINTWLNVFPGKYVGIAFGTNDAWGNQTGAAKYYTNTETMVKAVIAAGKIPVVSKIPYSKLTDISNYAPSYNAQIDALYAAYPQIIPGPDFWTFFQNNPSYLSGDNVHPSTEGYAAMRQQWANTMLTAVYSGTVVTPTATPVVTPTPVPTATPITTVTPTPVTVTPTPLVRTPTPVVATPTPGTGNYVVTYSMNDWGSGATVNITIKNNTSTAVNGWTLAWTFSGNQTITNLWSGSYTQNGTSVSVKDAGYNANISANGGTTNFGFNINYSGANAIPASFTLNGVACQVQ
jgi:lysophospholipase L1-like esterase